ncbi:FAD-binding domain-containing protein [Rickenella mellea]|uniref:FAD-binding domain-containing protein n=1 Tax=Rickenella mellea TaxID=50990 RepID=A0A4Y7Q987_9AGAM|nr:FAD-binding domain-containing protein [Rickenella mellea]
MVSTRTAGVGLAATVGFYAWLNARSEFASTAKTACHLLNQTFPDLVSFPGQNNPGKCHEGSAQYGIDINHWAVGSQQNATCSIEPQTPDDVSKIVKGGGHAFNRGFSSTTGIQISMARFNTASYNQASNTVTAGTGMTWDQLYAILEPLEVMVTGGRIPGVGISGLSLGGGYSWQTNQFGLTIDTIVAFDIVLPTGKFVHVTNDTQADIFFALKGGLNNFGVVTSITYEAHPQTLVYAGAITYTTNDAIDQLALAVEHFDLHNTDLKAQMVPIYIYAGQLSAELVIIYDAPTPPSGVFDAFFNIPFATSNVNTRHFAEFLTTTFGKGDLGLSPLQSALGVIPIVNYTVPVLTEIVNQVVTTGTSLTEKFSGLPVVVSLTVEPFTNPFAHSRGGAYPHPSSRQVTPSSPWIAVQANFDEERQSIMIDGIKTMSKAIQAKAVEVGQSRWDDLLYPNYALADTPLNLMYGDNVARLNNIAKKVDPHGVMKLSGGFKFG